jgi:FG-GAP-like repeat
VAVNDASNDITVLLGNGDGTFTAAASHSTIKHPFPIAVGDFNGDGKLDLAISSFDSNAITILLGKGDGTFTTAPTATAKALQPSHNGMIAGDFNGDGKTDLAVTNSQANTVTLLVGNGNGTLGAVNK